MPRTVSGVPTEGHLAFTSNLVEIGSTPGIKKLLILVVRMLGVRVTGYA